MTLWGPWVIVEAHGDREALGCFCTWLLGWVSVLWVRGVWRETSLGVQIMFWIHWKCGINKLWKHFLVKIVLCRVVIMTATHQVILRDLMEICQNTTFLVKVDPDMETHHDIKLNHILNGSVWDCGIFSCFHRKAVIFSMALKHILRLTFVTWERLSNDRVPLSSSIWMQRPDRVRWNYIGASAFFFKNIRSTKSF